jgi:hypothetical protein
MDEHRIAPRRRVLKAGSIAFGGGTIGCTVRSISDTGTALEIVTPLFIPDRFTPDHPDRPVETALSRRLAQGAADRRCVRLILG